MTVEAPPLPLGWCAWHMGAHEEAGAVTVYDGAALCELCVNAAQDGDADEFEAAVAEQHLGAPAS